MKNALLLTALLAAAALPVRAGLFITEVDPAGSSASYGADWFELTNTGSVALDITGWKMDDSSASFSTAVPLSIVTSIGAGQSVVFFEDNGTGSNDSTITANFKSAWFGSNVPSGFTIGAYGGSGVGLSTSGDGVNIFNASGVLQASVSFGAAPAGGATFDNSAELNGVPISQASVAGTHGAFVSANAAETGSPGVIASVPEPSAIVALLGGLGVVALRRRRAA